MAQSSALRDQPSMDEILASIRRIIDAGESHTAEPVRRKVEDQPPSEAVATVPPPPANDEGDDRSRVPQAALPNAPRTQRDAEKAAPGEIASAVSDYLDREHSTKPSGISQAVDAEITPMLKPQTAVAEDFPEPDISEVEAALRAEFNPVDRDVLTPRDRQAKYDARFTEADDGAFRQLGSLLRGKVADLSSGGLAVAEDGNPSGAETSLTTSSSKTEEPRGALVSDAVSQQVSHAFSDLSEIMAARQGRDLDAIAEDMLRPMLQDWLDNNLPSLVERLVRGEIERIARGEPRTAC